MATTYTITTSFTADSTAVASEVNQNFTDVLTALNAYDASNLSSGTVPIARISGLTTTQIAAATLVTEAEGLASSDNDTSWPTTAAVKDYVDTKEDILVTQSTASIFGSWTDKDSGGSVALANGEIYKVGSDGFVICYSATSPGTELTIHTDGNSTPATKRASSYGSGTGSINFGFCPIKKDDYFEVNNAGTGQIYWLPIGTGTCVKQ